MTSCRKLRKDTCTATTGCKWVTGKGCYDAQVAPTKPPGQKEQKPKPTNDKSHPSELPEHVWNVIANKVTNPFNRARLAAVSKTWHQRFPGPVTPINNLGFIINKAIDELSRWLSAKSTMVITAGRLALAVKINHRKGYINLHAYVDKSPNMKPFYDVANPKVAFKVDAEETLAKQGSMSIDTIKSLIIGKKRLKEEITLKRTTTGAEYNQLPETFTGSFAEYINLMEQIAIETNLKPKLLLCSTVSNSACEVFKKLSEDTINEMKIVFRRPQEVYRKIHEYKTLILSYDVDDYYDENGPTPLDPYPLNPNGNMPFNYIGPEDWPDIRGYCNTDWRVCENNCKISSVR